MGGPLVGRRAAPSRGRSATDEQPEGGRAWVARVRGAARGPGLQPTRARGARESEAAPHRREVVRRLASLKGAAGLSGAPAHRRREARGARQRVALGLGKIGGRATASRLDFGCFWSFGSNVWVERVRGACVP